MVIHYNENELKLSVSIDMTNGTANIKDENILATPVHLKMWQHTKKNGRRIG